jgi:hypothetical protein
LVPQGNFGDGKLPWVWSSLCLIEGTTPLRSEECLSLGSCHWPRWTGAMWVEIITSAFSYLCWWSTEMKRISFS